MSFVVVVKLGMVVEAAVAKAGDRDQFAARGVFYMPGLPSVWDPGLQDSGCVYVFFFL